MSIFNADYFRLMHEGGYSLADIKVPGWDLSVAKRDGKECAVVITHGNEIHFCSLGGPAMTRKNTLEYLKPILDEYGVVTTRVPIEVTDHKLRKILGFIQTWADTQFTYWAMTELPFSKKAKP